MATCHVLVEAGCEPVYVELTVRGMLSELAIVAALGALDPAFDASEWQLKEAVGGGNKYNCDDVLPKLLEGGYCEATAPRPEFILSRVGTRARSRGVTVDTARAPRAQQAGPRDTGPCFRLQRVSQRPAV